MKELEIVEYDAKQVIFKVNAKDPLTIARFPYLASNYEYITITRGAEHIVTIVNTDGTTFSFHFGRGGSTIISGNLKRLRNRLLELLKENYIVLDYEGKVPTKASIFYNSNFEKWEISFDSFVHFSDKATNLDEAIEEFEHLVKPKEWKKDIAPTGIDIWRAVEPEFNIN